MRSTYEIKPSKTNENNYHRCGRKGIGCVLVIRPNIWSVSTKHQLKKKEVEMNFTYRNGLEVT